MLNDLEDLENPDNEIEIYEDDYTDQTKKIRKKLLRKIWLVFISAIIIVITLFIDKHDDFDIVLKSSVFRYLLYITIIISIFALLYISKNKSQYNKIEVYKKHKTFSEIIDVLYIVPLFMALISLSNVLIFSPSYIDGASMEPNYFDGDDIVFWHLNNKYERYDVVILKAPSGDYWIKRIIGLPGDTITIEEGIVFVNGLIIDQEFLRDKDGSIDDYTVCRSTDPDFCEFNVPDNNYFVLGDNRDVSDDSRSNNLGYVSEDQLFGRVIFKFNNLFRN